MKDSFIKILEDYEKHLEIIKNMSNYSNIKHYLKSNHLLHGICYYTYKVFYNTDVFDYLLEKKYLNIDLGENSLYLCKRPIECKTKEEIIDTFKFRISKLKEIIQNEIQ